VWPCVFCFCATAGVWPCVLFFWHTVCVWPSVLCFCTQCACGRMLCVSAHNVRVAECFVFLHTVCMWPSVLCVYTQCALGRVFFMYAVCVRSYASIPKLSTEYDENSRCQLPVKFDKADLFWSVFQLMHFESRIPSA
jgi:uncharacterized integral membrane protein